MVFQNKKYNIHTHKSQTGVFEIFNQFPNNFIDQNQFYSLGIHPWFIDNEKLTEELEFIESKKEDFYFLAIGECGLDKLTSTNFDLQIKVFRQQIELAIHLKKPLIIHCVRAYQEVIAILKDYHLTIPIIFHGFNKNSILSFIREYTLLNTKDIRISMKKYKELYKFVKNDRLDKGLI